MPDDRFDNLVNIFKPKSEKPAILSIVDIAGNDILLYFIILLKNISQI